jgi:DNA-directed RNA polymerase specialized sigma24 family protein
MMCLRKNHLSTTEVDRYATYADFRRILSDNLDHLYLLAFLLTANDQKAEECLVTSIGDTVGGNPGFRDWVRSWTKRAVIKNAIHTLRLNASSTKFHLANTIPVRHSEHSSLKDFEIYRVLALDGFDRFVFVMSVLESYSDQDTSALLSCTSKQVQQGRVRALQQISAPFLRSYADKQAASRA